MRPAKKTVRSVVIHADVIVGGVTETDAIGMAAMLPKLRAMATWHLLLKHANANPNLSAMQHRSQS
jgi:hypothetical protein